MRNGREARKTSVFTDHLDAETLVPLLQCDPNLAIVVPEANRPPTAQRLGVATERLLGCDEGWKLELAGRLGADQVVRADQASEWFQNPARQVHVALVCATSVEAYHGALHSLRKGGEPLVVGLPPRPLGWQPQDLVRSGVRILPSHVSSSRELLELLDLASQGHVHSQISTHPLEEINDILERLEAGSLVGRAVCVI